jgi:alkylated DNA repair dioxygenase AlkB
MTARSQARLFPDVPEAGAFGIDTHFRRSARIALDSTSWVEVVSGWISGSDQLFDLLAVGVPWREHHRRVYGRRFLEPRLTHEYRDLESVPHTQLVEAAAALSTHYGRRYDSLWLNFYRDGRDSTGWHRDHFSCRRPDCVVPVLTLGSARPFLIKPRQGGASVRLHPRAGDLVVMGGRSQEDWLHGVPKVSEGVGPRISVNFQSSEQAKK